MIKTTAYLKFSKSSCFTNIVLYWFVCVSLKLPHVKMFVGNSVSIQEGIPWEQQVSMTSSTIYSGTPIHCPWFEVFFQLSFNVSDPKSIIPILNCPKLRFSSNLCSNPLHPKETLNMGFTVVGFHSMYTALLPLDIIVIFVFKMTHEHENKLYCMVENNICHLPFWSHWIYLLT